MSVIHSKAIILRHSTDREHDRLLTILTPGHGQLRVRARGTKKSTSKLAGSLEPVTEVDISIADGRTVGQVVGSVILERFADLHRDLVSSVSAQWLLELVAAVTKPAQDTHDIYQLVRQQLVDMSTERAWPVGRRWLILLRRASQVLTAEGFWPSLTICGRCHQRLDGAAVYEPAHGFVHEREADDKKLRLAPDVVAFVQTGDWPAADRPALLQLHKVVEAVIHRTIDQPLRSEKILRSSLRLQLPPAAKPE